MIVTLPILMRSHAELYHKLDKLEKSLALKNGSNTQKTIEKLSEMRKVLKQMTPVFDKHKNDSRKYDEMKTVKSLKKHVEYLFWQSQNMDSSEDIITDFDTSFVSKEIYEFAHLFGQLESVVKNGDGDEESSSKISNSAGKSKKKRGSLISLFTSSKKKKKGKEGLLDDTDDDVESDDNDDQNVAYHYC